MPATTSVPSEIKQMFENKPTDDPKWEPIIDPDLDEVPHSEDIDPHSDEASDPFYDSDGITHAGYDFLSRMDCQGNFC